MRIVAIPNKHIYGSSDLLTRVCDTLRAAGASVSVLAHHDGIPTSEEIAAALRDADAAIAIGGDGTIVHVAKAAATVDCPVLGINGGRLGFLAGLEQHEISELPRLLTGEYIEEPRTLLQVSVRRGDEERSYLAMNEAVIARGGLSQLLDLQVTSDGRDVLCCRGDGVIVATPTGSTAYSLSAGGPIVDPAVECMVLTPVCPHTVASRASLLPADAVLTVRASSADGGNAFLTVDGEESIGLSGDDSVTIRRAQPTARLMRMARATVYDILQQKMGGGKSI